MKIKLFAAGVLTLALAAPAAAQSVPDDARCFMLSNIFTKAAKDDKSKSVAAQSALFYLGRLDGRTNAQGLASALRSQRPTINAKDAGPLMTACAQHLGRAEQAMQATIQSIEPAAPTQPTR